MTRTEYLAKITAEFPGAYARIDDLMRSWDAVNAAKASAEDKAEAANWANAAPEGGDAQESAPAADPVSDEEAGE